MANRMELDLAYQLTDRIRVAVRDTLDTARRGSMPEQDAIMMVLTVLMTEAVFFFNDTATTEKAILKMASMSCREIERQLEAIKARRPAQH